ncbi:uncharacterized protein LOC133229620 isoform X1 [Bos javanicus]|nr:uncharacterized protein LOC133229620 isoform X1 [Bos javanicus]
MKSLLQSSYCVQSPMSTVEPISSWEEDRKFVLRAWCLVFIILATAMLLSVLDGRMAYLHGAYTGYVGFWTNCKKHTCADLRQVTVLIHMSMGFMILAVILALVLLLAMGFSFRPALRRLNKTDLVFSTLSSFTASCPSLAPSQCRAPDSPQPDALYSQLRDAQTEATGILPGDHLPELGCQRLDAVGRNPELLKLHGHVGQRDVLHGTADELPPVGLAAEHPEVHIRTAVVGRRLQARRGPVRLRACPPPPPPTSSLVQAS